MAYQHIIPEPTLFNRLRGLNNARKVLFNSRYSAQEREVAREWLDSPDGARARLVFARLLGTRKRKRGKAA
jgi:hypothetical protein